MKSVFRKQKTKITENVGHLVKLFIVPQNRSTRNTNTFDKILPLATLHIERKQVQNTISFTKYMYTF